MKLKKNLAGGVLFAAILLMCAISPHRAHAASINITANETWTSSTCLGAVNGSETSYDGINNGDSVTLQVTNNSSEELSVTVTGPGQTNYNMDIPAGQGSGNTWTVSKYLQVYATAKNCNSGGNDSYLIIEGASGNLACSASDSGKVWNITGQYSNIVPTVYMYRGATYVADINSTFPSKDIIDSTLAVDEQFSAQATAQTYNLYNGTSSSVPLIGQATCPAYTAVASSNSSPPTTTTTPTATPTTTAPTTSSPSNSTSTPTASTNSTGNTFSLTPTAAKSNPKFSAKNLAILLFFGVIVWALFIVVYWKVLEKAGRHGWIALIPVYSTWVIYEISGYKGWWAILQLIPFVNLVAYVVYIMALYRLRGCFGKGFWFWLFWMWWFPFVGWPILAFGKAQYNNPDSPTYSPPANSPNLPLSPPANNPSAPYQTSAVPNAQLNPIVTGNFTPLTTPNYTQPNQVADIPSAVPQNPNNDPADSSKPSSNPPTFQNN